MGKDRRRYTRRRCLTYRHREALRLVLLGHTHRAVATATGFSPKTIGALVQSTAGREFLRREAERVDAHRTLLAASLPYLTLLDTNAHARESVTPAQSRKRPRRSAPNAAPAAPGCETTGGEGVAGA